MLGIIQIINGKLVIEYQINNFISNYKVSSYKKSVANICSSQTRLILENKLIGRQVNFIILSQANTALITL